VKRWSAKILATVLGSWLGWRRGSQTALPFQGEGKMLDFGCGSGWYAHRMQQIGWKVTGMDFSEHASAQIRRHYNLPVLVGTLPHPEITPGSFDLITMGCVLEHVHWPHRVVEAAARALRPGGSLVVSVPNLASWGFRYFGTNWWPLELPLHLLHFSPGSLRRLMKAHGLEVSEMRMVARASWMRNSFAAARSPKGTSSGRLLTRLSGVRLIPSLMTRFTTWTGQADCILIHAKAPTESSARRRPR
jgi:2-polyprenyl-3-methyl-5-hydroxy-6-metoxy-1,4-benzoquinol methylase